MLSSEGNKTRPRTMSAGELGFVEINPGRKSIATVAVAGKHDNGIIVVRPVPNQISPTIENGDVVVLSLW